MKHAAVAAAVAVASGCSAILGADFGDYGPAGGGGDDGAAGGPVAATSTDAASSSSSSSSVAASTATGPGSGGSGGDGGSGGATPVDPCAPCQALDASSCPAVLARYTFGSAASERISGGLDGDGAGRLVAAARSLDIGENEGFQILELDGSTVRSDRTYVSPMFDAVADVVNAVTLTDRGHVAGGRAGNYLPPPMESSTLDGYAAEGFLYDGTTLRGGDAMDNHSSVLSLAERHDVVAFAGRVDRANLGLGVPEAPATRFFVGTATDALNAPAALSLDRDGGYAAPCDDRDPNGSLPLDVDLGAGGLWLTGQVCGELDGGGPAPLTADRQGFVAALAEGAAIGQKPTLEEAVLVGPPASEVELRAIADATPDGGARRVVVGGTGVEAFSLGDCEIESPGSERDAFVLGLSADGGLTCRWAITLGGPGDDAVRDLAVVPEQGRLVIAGHTAGSGFDTSGRALACDGPERRAFVALLTLDAELGAPTIDWVLVLGERGAHSAASVAIERWDAGVRRIAVSIESHGGLGVEGTDFEAAARVHLIRLELPASAP